MPSLESLVPEIAAYQQAQEAGQRRQLGQLQQAQGLIGILSAVQQQQQRQQALAKQQSYQGALSALGPNATDEDVLRVARQHAGADDLLRTLTSSRDRQAATQATKEATLARLQQAAQQFEATHEARLRGLSRQEDKDAEIRRHNQVMESLQGQAQRMTGERLFYDTGIRVQPAPTSGAPAGALASPQPTMALQLPAGQALQGSSPSYNDALAMFAGGGGVPRTLTYPEGTGPSFGSAQAAPAEAQPVAPAAPNNLDARDLLLQNMRRPATNPGGGTFDASGMPSYQSPARTMPEFFGSPKQQSDARNRWLLGQEGEANRAGRVDLKVGSTNQLTDADKDYYAAYILLNGRMPIGLSRIGPEATQSIMSRVSERAASMGMNPEDFAAAGPIVKTKLSALMQLEKNANAVQAYEGMLVKNIDILKELSANLPREKAPVLNRPILWVQNNMRGDPAVSDYLFQVNTVATEIARVLNNPNLTGQLTDTARRELESVVKGSYNHEQLMRVLNRAQADAVNRAKSFDEQKDKVILEVRSLGQGSLDRGRIGAGGSGGWSIRPR